MDKMEPEFSVDMPPAESLGWFEKMEASRLEERRVLEGILHANFKEQQKNRRGRNWFRLFIAAYLVVLLVMGAASDLADVELDTIGGGKPHTAVVDILGPIAAGKPFSADHVIKGLTRAFKDPDTKGVILRINSPGGSPVQAGQIYDELGRLQKRYPNKPLYAALEDLCASGGYYIAAAAPKIYADKATLVGSIGVVMQGFGLEETLKKVGVESRLLTAGRNKAFLNPFAPWNPEEKKHAQGLLKKIHLQFINAVRKGRGKRLKTWKTDLFEGLMWTGEEAVELGLVDGLGSAAWIARELIKADRLVAFTDKEEWFDRLAKRFGLAVFEQVTPNTSWQWR